MHSCEVHVSQKLYMRRWGGVELDAVDKAGGVGVGGVVDGGGDVV